MYNYSVTEIERLLTIIIQQHTSAEAWQWLQQKGAAVQAEKEAAAALNLAFVTAPRKMGKNPVPFTAEGERLQHQPPYLYIQLWTIDRLSRVWLLLQLDTADEKVYVRKIENLFLTAEMNELVALYSALPLLAYPQAWRQRCAEGTRSNIGKVLEAIMCHNSYPAAYLDNAAWNQLVLKAFFTDKPVHQIRGLDQRANKELAYTISDYVHERWAAHRPVNPQLWRCVGPFIDERIFMDIVRLAASENTVEREAAALACAQSHYPPAQQLLESKKDLKSLITAGKLTWQTVAEKAQLVF